MWSCCRGKRVLLKDKIHASPDDRFRFNSLQNHTKSLNFCIYHIYLVISQPNSIFLQTMKKLFIETYGCQMNVADSEVVASIMQMAGYELCEDENMADAILLNTCSIRENAENKIYNRLETLYAEQKKGRRLILGVLGCMAERVKDAS